MPADVTQFGAAVLEHLDLLYRTARRLTRSEADAEDLVQDTVLRALERRHLFREGTFLRAWLLTMMTRLYINRYQRDQRSPRPLSLDELEDFDLYSQISAEPTGLSADPADLVETLLAAERVNKAIDELPDEFRPVVALALVDELSYAEVAAALDIPVGTVRSRLSRGRNLLRRSLAEYGQGKSESL